MNALDKLKNKDFSQRGAIGKVIVLAWEEIQIGNLAEQAAAELAALRAELEQARGERDELREALQKISEFDASNRIGIVDEWEEAWAFGECVKIAAAALKRGQA